MRGRGCQQDTSPSEDGLELEGGLEAAFPHLLRRTVGLAA